MELGQKFIYQSIIETLLCENISFCFLFVWIGYEETPFGGWKFVDIKVCMTIFWTLILRTLFFHLFFSSTTILVKVLLTVSNKKQLGFTSTEREFVERILRYLTGYMEGLKKKKSRPLKGKGQELVMKFQ